MHSKLHGIGIDQQGFLEAQQDFQLYRIFQASDSLCVCVGKVKKKQNKKKTGEKSIWINQVVLGQTYIQCSCLFFSYFVQCFEAQTVGKEGLEILKHIT